MDRRMSPRHILLANVFFAPYSYGGATIVAEQVAHALIRKGGYEVTAVSLCCRHDLAPYTLIRSEQNGITNYIINVPHGREYAQMYDNPQVTEVLKELIGWLKPDLVHAHCIQDIGTGILEAAEAAGVPVMPATKPLPEDAATIKQLASDVGYPLMLKASWGGGGRGMRVVTEPQQICMQKAFRLQL